MAVPWNDGNSETPLARGLAVIQPVDYFLFADYTPRMDRDGPFGNRVDFQTGNLGIIVGIVEGSSRAGSSAYVIWRGDLSARPFLVP